MRNALCRRAISNQEFPHEFYAISSYNSPFFQQRNNLLAWHKMRGTQMIAVIKITSIAFDIVRDRLKKMPFGGFIAIISTYFISSLLHEKLLFCYFGAGVLPSIIAKADTIFQCIKNIKKDLPPIESFHVLLLLRSDLS